MPARLPYADHIDSMMVVMEGRMSEFVDKPEVGQKAPTVQERIDEARAKYLRVFCDVYFPQIVDRAISGEKDAVYMLVFVARERFQTPKHSELDISTYWLALKRLEPTIAAE